MSLPSQIVRTWAGACAAICECGRLAQPEWPVSESVFQRPAGRDASFGYMKPLNVQCLWRSRGHFAVAVRCVRIRNRGTRWQKQCLFASLPVQRYTPTVGTVHFRFVWGRGLLTDEMACHFRKYLYQHSVSCFPRVCYMTCPSQYPTLLKRSGEDEIRRSVTESCYKSHFKCVQ